MRGRQRLSAVVILVGAIVIGYLITVWAYPAPLIVGDRAVARVLGLPISAAQQELEEQGFKVRVEEPVPDPVIPPGRVVWQDPPSEMVLPRTGTVHLVPSAGPATVPVPDVAQFELEQGRQIIEAAGFRVGSIDTIPSGAVPGVIVSTRPGSGSMRPPGTTVEVAVSRGPSDIRVPNLVGLPHDEARERLEALGLRVGTVRTREGGAAGTVLDQQPSAGILAPKDGRVNLLIAADRP